MADFDVQFEELNSQINVQMSQSDQSMQVQMDEVIKGDKGDTGEKGDKGDKGDTGAMIVSQTLIGQDQSGGNIYQQTFDDGTTAQFTAPKGIKGDTGDKGENGADGADGSDGISPTTSISKAGKVTTVTFTGADGAHTATINDGADGDDGQDGYSPVRGTDYWTESDKEEIVDDVMDEVGDVVHYTADTTTAVQRAIARENIKAASNEIIATATFPHIRCTSAAIYNGSYQYFKFGEISPVDYAKKCSVKLRFRASLVDGDSWAEQEATATLHFSPVVGTDSIVTYGYRGFDLDNYFANGKHLMQYLPFKPLTERGLDNEATIPFGLKMHSSAYCYNTHERNVTVDVLECDNATVALETPSATTFGMAVANFLGSGSAADYASVTDFASTTFGNTHTGDANTTYSMDYLHSMGSRVIGDNGYTGSNEKKIYYYRIVCETPDGLVEGLTVTYNTAVKNVVRKPNLHLSALFGGQIGTYSSTTARDIGYAFTSGALRTTSATLDIRYNVSCNSSSQAIIGDTAITAACNRNVYLKALINDDGISWSLDPSISETDISEHLTFDLPTTDDGYIYIQLFRFCNSATVMHQSEVHHIYKHDGTNLMIIG